ncbi:MAG: elongation factor 4 [Chloroflexi bacterium]|nr:elongation factor 4 [Chloroflexota bacterium]
MDRSRIRNFCIIAHIDHGKSTLADRFLEQTGLMEGARGEGRGTRSEPVEQVLDSMDLEREKGVTIKAKAVRLPYRAEDGLDYQLNLIDTPGHVDFSYEVSRALAACEGAILVVDASQGIQAQTIANVHVAMDHNLKIIPVVNKIDLPSAEPEAVVNQVCDVIGFNREEVLLASAKEGTGTHEILEAVVRLVPSPGGDETAPLRALIFDSKYDSYKGVIAYLRVIDGAIEDERGLRLMTTEQDIEALEVGTFSPQPVPSGRLSTGEVGYVATGLKDVRQCRVGDTLTDSAKPAAEALTGYQQAKPMVFSGLYPTQPNDYGLLREALEKLQLNDAALSFEPETSVALGPGFRCGFLGLLHMEIVQERLEREYDLELLITAPSVEYQVLRTDGEEIVVDNPAALPPPSEIEEIREPWMAISVVCPDRYIGAVMELVTSRRGVFERMEYIQGTGDEEPGTRAHSALSEKRVILAYQIPLSEILVDFYDQLKSMTQGYASLDYHLDHHAAAKLVKLDILVAGEPVDALSLITLSEKAQAQGRALVQRLRSLIPRQLFDVPIQAAVGGRIVSRETVRALRKNVLAKCYGGDVTRKRKLLERQKEGKKRMKRVGNVEIPQEAFLAVLRLEK